MRKFTRRLIESMQDYCVCGEAVDGLDAIEKARELNPDLIILDLAMPRMNGLDAAQVLRNTGVRAPIILFTLHAGIVSHEEVSAMGIDAVVPKVDDPRGLLSQVERLLAAAPPVLKQAASNRM
jgi:DNA-binding NarL/FixJ family response regulator